MGKRLSEAQEKFLRDPRPYVKGSYGSPAVRTMFALEKKKLITVEQSFAGGCTAYETKLTDAGRAALAERGA